MNKNLVEIWEKAIEFMMSDLDITKVQYDTWIKKLEPFELSDSIIILKSPSVIKGVIEERYLSTIEKSINSVTDEEYSVEIIPLEEDETSEDETSATLLLDKLVDGEENILNIDSGSEAVNSEIKVTNSELEDEVNRLDKNQFEDNITLNPKYTFDSFVIGNSNRFAHAASLAV